MIKEDFVLRARGSTRAIDNAHGLPDRGDRRGEGLEGMVEPTIFEEAKIEKRRHGKAGQHPVSVRNMNAPAL